MSVQTQIDRISVAVSEQDGLIQQIRAALEGKAAGGGSGGSGGESVETCTVTVTNANKFEPSYFCYMSDSMSPTIGEIDTRSSSTFTVVKGSLGVVLNLQPQNEPSVTGDIIMTTYSTSYEFAAVKINGEGEIEIG